MSTQFFRYSNLFRRTAALPVLLMVLLCWISSVARAQPQPPYALFQFSTLTGSGTTITATQVPVVIGSGITVYVNLTMQFNVDANGSMTLAPGYPQVVAAPILLSSSFLAGKYVGPSSILGGKVTATVSGPGVSDGGASVWSLNATSSDPCTYPSSATWYTGPIVSSPVAARLTKAGITSTAWSYGVGGGPGYFVTCASGSGFSKYFWGPGTLIGVSQSGNAITIASFTDAAAGVDRNAPVDQITFTLAP